MCHSAMYNVLAVRADSVSLRDSLAAATLLDEVQLCGLWT